MTAYITGTMAVVRISIMWMWIQAKEHLWVMSLVLLDLLNHWYRLLRTTEITRFDNLRLGIDSSRGNSIEAGTSVVIVEGKTANEYWMEIETPLVSLVATIIVHNFIEEWKS
jgi:hypothetical protein